MLSTALRRSTPRGSSYIRSRLYFPSTRSISRLRVPEVATLSKSTQQIIQAHHGDNWTRALALNPDTLRRFVTHYEDLFTDQTTKLNAIDREIVAVVVSHTTGCGYCQTYHTHGLTAALGKDNAAKLRAKKIALGWHLVGDLSEKHKILAAFSELLASNPKGVGKQQLIELKKVGYEEEEIVEIIEVIGWFSHSNRLMIALGVEIDDKNLE
ncbi:AhpD-like protein [Fusarium flagelliforme]|uniref:AhpD-like protein n=1 Tax=Fusarium flagelliforme TaxID=2675880 RepID=UPI001E8CD7EF|nr:AhpD-like protein [Fusarium flagelliforme]KAH7182305.1 AhpD-like protein [Fusarium flagelliforme]